MENIVKIGVGVFVFKDGMFLMGKRKNAHGNNTWSVPGGNLEFRESPHQTATREVLEETGLRIKNVRFGAITNDFFPIENKHYITIWLLSEWKSGKENIKEPDKFIEIGWFNFNNLPKPLFSPWKVLLKSEFIESIKGLAKKTG